MHKMGLYLYILTKIKTLWARLWGYKVVFVKEKNSGNTQVLIARPWWDPFNKNDVYELYVKIHGKRQYLNKNGYIEYFSKDWKYRDSFIITHYWMYAYTENHTEQLLRNV